MKNLRYLISLIPACLALTGNVCGGNFILLNLFYTFIGLVLLDRIWKEDKTSPQDTEATLIPNLILIGSSLLHALVIFTLLWGIYSRTITGVYIAFAILSTALNSGISGIISAHEMIHRKQKAWNYLGIWNLLLVNYAHFFIEHIKVHHKWVGTSKDAATARYGESIYSFIGRTIPGQFISAFSTEVTRLKKENKNAYGFQNFVLSSLAIQFFICGFIFSLLGAQVLLAYLLQSFIAILLLEYVNYIEHYGLSRSEDEKYSAAHAWQSDIPISRFTLIELSRHSDHHLRASKPYNTLVSHEASPVLPSGYFGVFYLALVPSLWFKLVHPILQKRSAMGEKV